MELNVRAKRILSFLFVRLSVDVEWTSSMFRERRENLFLRLPNNWTV